MEVAVYYVGPALAQHRANFSCSQFALPMLGQRLRRRQSWLIWSKSLLFAGFCTSWHSRLAGPDLVQIRQIWLETRRKAYCMDSNSGRVGCLSSRLGVGAYALLQTIQRCGLECAVLSTSMTNGILRAYCTLDLYDRHIKNPWSHSIKDLGMWSK